MGNHAETASAGGGIMAGHYFYCNRKNRDVGEWYESLDSGLRSEIVVSLLRAYMENDDNGRRIVSSVEDRHDSLMDDMRGVVDRMFSDITNETRWIRDAWSTGMNASTVINNRLDDVKRKCPVTVHKEIIPYFRERFPKLAKEAGV